MYVRICPNCNKEVKHNSKYNLKRALKTNKRCRSCVALDPKNIKARTDGIKKSIEAGTWVSSMKGVKQSPETIEKRLKSRGLNYAEGPNWTRGTRGQYHTWARKVKNRDNKRCVYCASTGKLHAHHILTKNKHPEWSLFLDNGITLCQTCHWEEHRLNGYL